MNHVFRSLVLLLLPVVTAGAAHAQFYDTWHRPVDVAYLQFDTPHFQVIYQRGLSAEAVEMAQLLEAILPEVRAVVGLRRSLDVPLVLNRFTDRGNGFVTPLPFRQEIEAVAHRGNSLSPRFHSWFETVGPHELVHAAHAESGRGFGLGWILRRIGPDLARSLNLSGPRGITEGAAVWYESSFRPGAGRLHHSLFDMEFRAAMLSADPWSLAQMLEPPSYTRPFDRYYHGGAHLFEYMAQRDGDVRFFRRARNFYYRFPLLGYGPALWYGTRMMPHTLGRRMRQHFRDEAAASIASRGKLTHPEIISSRRGTVHRRPIWLDDETLIVYSAGYHLRPGFYRVTARSGDLEPLAHEAISEDILYSLTSDSSAVLFSRYVPDVFEAIRSVADVFRLDIASGDVSRVTDGGRTFAPVEAPTGRIWALRNAAQFNEWVEFGGDDVAIRLSGFERTSILSIVPSPGGDRVVALVHREGRQGVHELVEREGGYDLDPLIHFQDASVFDVSWGPNGRYLVFSADPDGVANVFAWDSGTGQVRRLTNVAFGAIEPSISPDGSAVAFINYRHERYDLVQIPFRQDQWTVDGGQLTKDQLTVDSGLLTGLNLANRSVVAAEVDTPQGGRPYVPLLEIRPRVFYPFLLYQRPTGDDDDVHLGFGAGAGLEWADPLQYWTAHTSGYYQKGTVWGRLQVRSGQFMLRPTAEVFREPSTLVVRRIRGGNVDTVRVGRDERGIGMGVRVPAVLESNVFQTTALATVSAEYRSERLFDDDGETIRDADDRITLRPSIQINYRMQANPRDIVPNSGFRISSFAHLDAWSERDLPARFIRARSELYLPFFRPSSTGLSVHGSIHVQNRGGIVDLTSFFPRGYETDTVFLDEGAYGKLGLELTQPLWYIDDGFILLPLYFRAIFAYAFAEMMQPLDDDEGEGVRRTVMGGGLGVQARFGYGINVTLRVAPVYRFRENDWNVTFR